MPSSLSTSKYFLSASAASMFEAITFSYMPYWRATEAKVEGSSQRIQEDCMNFAKIVESIGLQVVKAIMTLIAFIPILWVLSSNVTVPFLGDVSGSLVWVALILSLGGILISWLVGIKLPGLEFKNQRVEAAFRKELVLGEDTSTKADPPTLVELFNNVRRNYFRIYFHYAYFNLARYLYLQADNIIVYMFLIPTIVSGKITLGIMNQILRAFGQVASSFQFLVNSWTTIKRKSICKK